MNGTQGHNRGEAAGGENESEPFLRSITSGGGLEDVAVATLLRNRLRVPTEAGDGDATRVSAVVLHGRTWRGCRSASLG